MKPTVGLTSFLRLMNLCEKKRDSANVYGCLVIFKKTAFSGRAKKEFSLQTK